MKAATKNHAKQLVKDLEALPGMSFRNSASYFANSIEWHPRWSLIFSLIDEVRSEYEFLISIRDEIADAIAKGEVETITDWRQGWQWKASIVRVNGRRIRVFFNKQISVCLYQGQHDKPVLRLN